MGDVGDDTTHESCNVSDVIVGAAAAAASASRKNDLLDLDTPANPQVQQPAVAQVTVAQPAAVPPSVQLANTLAGLDLGAAPAPAASTASCPGYGFQQPVAGADRFAALGAGGGVQSLGTTQWPPATAAPAAAPMGGMRPAAGVGGYQPTANFASFPAPAGGTAFGGGGAFGGGAMGGGAMGGGAMGGGVAFGTMGGGAKMSIPPPAVPSGGSSGSPAKKDFQLGDAFELTGMR